MVCVGFLFRVGSCDFRGWFLYDWKISTTNTHEPTPSQRPRHENNLSIFDETSADRYEDAGAINIKTQPSARTMAFDSKTKNIYLPAADYTETPATEPGRRPIRTMKPGSFVVLVVIEA